MRTESVIAKAVCIFFFGIVAQQVAFNCVAGQSLESSEEIVAFFKTALSSPPDIEYYLVSRHQLRDRRASSGKNAERAPQFWHGARAGANYFLCAAGSGKEPLAISASPMVVGRHGSGAYQLSANTITLTHDQSGRFPGHPLHGVARGFYDSVNQDLSMGLGVISQSGVAWNGNAFEGSLNGKAVYGELQLSNGLPSRAIMSSRKGGPPFKACTYSYPSPPSAFAGFPANILISTLSKDDLLPYLEISFLKVRVAESRLAESFFSETQFLTTNIFHKNIVSNAVLFAVSSNGNLITLNSPVKQLSNRIRSVVLTVMFTATAGFAIVMYKFLTTRKQRTT